MAKSINSQHHLYTYRAPASKNARTAGFLCQMVCIAISRIPHIAQIRRRRCDGLVEFQD
jgi:hypothetical protein